ncbi:MAG: MBL fold metallo-hydrolase [Chloroflexota bacterium]
MRTKEIDKNIFLIDLQTGGFRNLIASYILKGEQIAIVETGPTLSIPNLLIGLEELGVKSDEVVYIALSHVHIDHSGGVGTLLRKLPNAKVIVHSKGAPHLIEPTRLWAASQETLGIFAEMFGKPDPVPKNKIILATDGKTLELGKGLRLEVIESPGHASHNVSYYEHLNQGIFPGDAAGAYFAEFDTVFPTTPPPFRPDIALTSIDKLITFNPTVLYYSHFGKALNAFRHLRDYQLQIRRWLSIVQESLRRKESLDMICERILEEDESIRKVVPALAANPLYRKTLIENSVQGFMEYVAKPAT